MAIEGKGKCPGWSSDVRIGPTGKEEQRRRAEEEKGWEAGRIEAQRRRETQEKNFQAQYGENLAKAALAYISLHDQEVRKNLYPHLAEALLEGLETQPVGERTQWLSGFLTDLHGLRRS